ncbi:MAG TPA: arsenic resistance N-acetyltransferase ArsN2 [Longimicrobium sp.]|nr:arsenic resistance N-acetyltransferase ArsN2 [Longimicrobium sp.]
MHPSARTLIEPARAGDLDAVLDLLRGAALPPDGTHAHFPDGFVVARAAGHFVTGCAGVEIYGEVGLLRSVAVLEEARGTGLGERLARAALRRAAERGVRDVYLLTTTAEGFFPRLGFERVERASLPEALEASEQLRGVCPASAAAMRLRLEDAAP